ncbi:hypothetical protein ACP4OV_011615 [Aristida adscensionis]
MSHDPTFVAAHRARHPEPLIVVGLVSGEEILVMDLSANILKRIRITGFEMVLPTNLDIVYAVKDHNSHSDAIVINAATGVVHALPKNLAADSQLYGKPLYDYSASFVFGRVATGEYKVLRILSDVERPFQILEVLTLDSNGPMQWRAKQSLPICVQTYPIYRVVIKGVVYFLEEDRLDLGLNNVARFDLETEKWIPSLRGPLSRDLSEDHPLAHHSCVCHEFASLAQLNDFLVVAQYRYHLDYNYIELLPGGTFLDLWYPVDMENCLWERKYRIDLTMIQDCSMAYPSLILDDGGLLLCLSVAKKIFRQQYSGYSVKVLRRYDPETKTLTHDLFDNMDISDFGLCTGSLLGVRNGEEL